jgi:TPR repeat protein
VRVLQIIAAAGLALVCAAAPGYAEKRVALVVGNAAYRHADRLANPVNDAQGVRDALKKLGFDVVYGEDLDQRGLRRVIGQFANSVTDADVAMVYFAGHGATFGDVPYVVPVDAEFASLGEVAYELVPVEVLIGELRQAKGVRIAVLDACRDNAAERELKRQASRGGEMSRGLAPMKNPGGLIIAYATQYLSTASDGAAAAAPHSPFTAALLNNIATPGLDVKDMFYKVGREVSAATGGKQRPEISVSMYDQYALAPGAASVPATAPSAAAPPAGGTAVPDAERTWGIIQNTTSVAALDDFIRQFGNVPIYGVLAHERREALAKQHAREPVSQPAKPADAQQTAAVAPPVKPAQPAQGSREPDVAYAAYQRGYFRTAFQEATKRADNGDARAMTLLGELYADGFGMLQDESMAVKWYKLAADHGDRDAMFALGVFHTTGRGGLHDRGEAAKLFAAAAQLGHATAAYNLGLLYLKGEQFKQDFGRAAELFKMASEQGQAEAQYALATLYKDGKGVDRNPEEATRLLGNAALAKNVDAQAEYSIMLFNGTGIAADQTRARALLCEAALRGSPIAANRLAQLLMPTNPAEAVTWHLIAKARGKGDPALDQYVARQTRQIRTAAEKTASGGSSSRPLCSTKLP